MRSGKQVGVQDADVELRVLHSGKSVFTPVIQGRFFTDLWQQNHQEAQSCGTVVRFTKKLETSIRSGQDFKKLQQKFRYVRSTSYNLKLSKFGSEEY